MSHLDEIFNLYFTTKENKNNMGMGLSMAKKIMETSLNGSLKVENTTYGARFIVGCHHE